MAKKQNLDHRPYLYDVGELFQTKNGIMTVVDRFRVQRADQIYRKQYMIRCEQGHQYPVDESYLKNRSLTTCKMCNHPPIIQTDPDFAAWFVDPKIPLEKTRYSHCKADFYCQNCGKVVEGKGIHTIYQRRQVPCPYCTSGISYPERYMDALLTQMNISFVRQYLVKLKVDGRKTHYKYDFYDKERMLVIEVHGSQHFLPGAFEKMGGQSLEEIKQRDAAKEAFARQTFALGYIALDCRKSDPNWIKQEVIKKLKMYPLEMVNWEQLCHDTNCSLVLQLIRLSKAGYTQKQIGKMVHLHRGTVCIKLRQAVRDGLFDGITPRILGTAERKRIEEERKARSLAEKQRREEEKQKIQERRRKYLENRGPTSHEDLLTQLQKKNLDLIVLDQFVDSRTAISFRCQTCNQVFQRTPQWIRQNPFCPYCKKREEIKKKVLEKFGDAYEIRGIYTNAKTPIEIYHKQCKDTFYKTARSFLKPVAPPVQSKNRESKDSTKCCRKFNPEDTLL